MTTPTHIASIDRGQPTEASAKRKCEMEAPSDVEKLVDRKYDLDLDILECPVCSEPFAPPVYQCSRGHTICSDCRSKLAGMKCPTCTFPIGNIRCMAIEKILESLLVSCKYAVYGCKKMLKKTNVVGHEKDLCQYKPFRCPVAECSFEGSDVTLPVHLAEEHQVRRVALNKISGAGFIMESSDRLVMVKGDEESDVLFLVHRQVHEPLGDAFLCTSLGVGSSRFLSYNLQVSLCSYPSNSYHMTEACAFNLWDMTQEFWKRDFLLLPFYRRDTSHPHGAVKVLFTLTRNWT